MTPKCSNPLQSVAKSLVDIANRRILSPLRLPIPPSGPTGKFTRFTRSLQPTVKTRATPNTPSLPPSAARQG